MKKHLRFLIALVLSGFAFVKPSSANNVTEKPDVANRINAVRQTVRTASKTPKDFEKLKIFDFSGEPMAQIWIKWPNWNNWANWNNWHNWPNFHNWANFHHDHGHDHDHR